MYDSTTQTIDIDHVLSTLSTLLKNGITVHHVCNKNPSATYYYIDAEKTSHVSWNIDNNVYFMNISLPNGFDYYITHWSNIGRTVVTLSHDRFGFEDQFNQSKLVNVQYFDSEEEHFQESLLDKKINYPYELVEVLQKIKLEVKKIHDNFVP